MDFIFGLTGNVFALWILFFKSPWKACNVYLFCLVISDLLLLTGLPFRIDYLFRGEEWIFGESICHLILYIISVNYSASMAFMSILAVDRFFRILHPHHRICRMGVRQALMLASMVWMIVLLLRLPTALNLVLTSQKNSSKLTCHSFLSWTWPSVQMRIYNSVQLIEVLLAFALVVFCLVRVSFHVHRQSKGAHRRVITGSEIASVYCDHICSVFPAYSDFWHLPSSVFLFRIPHGVFSCFFSFNLHEQCTGSSHLLPH